MLKVLIIGGKLQGSEVAYLGHKAGFEVILVDKDKNAPAQNLCDLFICDDITDPGLKVKSYMKTADLIIPTLEDKEALECIVKLCAVLNIKERLAFDPDAFRISSSKISSDRLFHNNDLPSPRYYPDGDFPYIAKPSGESGSKGIIRIDSTIDYKKFEEGKKEDYIIQEFVEGPSYSVEIIGYPGNYRSYVLTEIFVDCGYDCNCVGVLRNVDPTVERKIRDMVHQIAELIKLKGIMDLEVIVHDGQIRILEIDARFPSQTPIAVYHASGMNYVKELYDITVKGDFTCSQNDDGKYATLIHFLVHDNSYETLGEHIMTEGGLLYYTESITENAVVISDYNGNYNDWRCTFICEGETLEELTEKRDKAENDLLNKSYMT